VTVKDIMKKLWKTNLSSEAKHRVTLVLIGVLAVNTVGIALVVSDMRTQIGKEIAFGKSAIIPTPISRTKTTPVSTSATPTSTTEQTGGKSGGGSNLPPPGSTIPPPVAGNEPYPGAPACPATAHTTSKFHTLWDPVLRCHYDHEHGVSPFTAEVAAAFPGFNLLSLLGNVEIGHTNLSGPMENTHKHGGFKWNIQLAHPQGCQGFESSTHGVNGSTVLYHAFGDYGVEMEANVHTAAALLRLCNASNPNDYGYLYTTQFQNYGQVVVPYQGTVMPFPHNSVPIYNSGSGQYISVDCIGLDPADPRRCDRDIAEALRSGAGSSWTSKRTGSGARPETSTLFRLLLRVGDLYRAFDWSDQTYPYTFLWICTSDGGLTYNPARCTFNNTTTQVHEIAGVIPPAWDNLAGFDTDARVGRITAVGYTTKYGERNPACTAIGPDCHPIKMVNAFVGSYGSVLVFTPRKGENIVPYLPERDIYFCNGVACAETDPGAISSGWIGQSN